MQDFYHQEHPEQTGSIGVMENGSKFVRSQRIFLALARFAGALGGFGPNPEAELPRTPCRTRGGLWSRISTRSCPSEVKLTGLSLCSELEAYRAVPSTKAPNRPPLPLQAALEAGLVLSIPLRIFGLLQEVVGGIADLRAAWHDNHHGTSESENRNQPDPRTPHATSAPTWTLRCDRFKCPHLPWALIYPGPHDPTFSMPARLAFWILTTQSR